VTRALGLAGSHRLMVKSSRDNIVAEIDDAGIQKSSRSI